MAIRLANISTPFLVFKIIIGSFEANGAVPQGSHIGPLMFITFTMEIKMIIELADLEELEVFLSIFADDTKLIAIVNNQRQKDKLQDIIDKLFNWAKTNRLTINKEQTVFMSYRKT